MTRPVVRWGLTCGGTNVLLTFTVPSGTTPDRADASIDSDAETGQHWLRVSAYSPAGDTLLETRIELYGPSLCCEEGVRVMPMGDVRVKLALPSDGSPPWPRLTRYPHSEAPVSIYTDWDLFDEFDASDECAP